MLGNFAEMAQNVILIVVPSSN